MGTVRRLHLHYQTHFKRGIGGDFGNLLVTEFHPRAGFVQTYNNVTRSDHEPQWITAIALIRRAAEQPPIRIANSLKLRDDGS